MSSFKNIKDKKQCLAEFKDLIDTHSAMLAEMSLAGAAVYEKVSHCSAFLRVLVQYAPLTPLRFQLLVRAFMSNLDPADIQREIFQLDTQFTDTATYLYFGLNRNKIVLYTDGRWTTCRHHGRIRADHPIWREIEHKVAGKTVILWDRRVLKYVALPHTVALQDAFRHKHVYEAARFQKIVSPAGHNRHNLFYYVWFMSQLLQKKAAPAHVVVPSTKKPIAASKHTLLHANGLRSFIPIFESLSAQRQRRVLGTQERVRQWLRMNHMHGRFYGEVWEAFFTTLRHSYSEYEALLAYFKDRENMRRFTAAVRFFKRSRVDYPLPRLEKLSQDVPVFLSAHANLRYCFTALNIPKQDPTDYLPYIDLHQTYLGKSHEEIRSQFILRQMQIHPTDRIHKGIKFMDLEFTSDHRLREICLLDDKHLYLHEMHFDRASRKRKRELLRSLAHHFYGSIFLGCGTDCDTRCLQHEYQIARMRVPRWLSHRGRGRVVNLQSLYGLIHKEGFVRGLQYLAEQYHVEPLCGSRWHLSLQDTFSISQIFAKLAPELLTLKKTSSITPSFILSLEREFERTLHPVPKQAEFSFI